METKLERYKLITYAINNPKMALQKMPKNVAIGFKSNAALVLPLDFKFAGSVEVGVTVDVSVDAVAEVGSRTVLFVRYAVILRQVSKVTKIPPALATAAIVKLSESTEFGAVSCNKAIVDNPPVKPAIILLE